MTEQLRVNIDPHILDAALAVLLDALSPKVAFSNDLEAMREEAERARVFYVKTAIATLYNQTPGLTHRPTLEAIVDEIGSATIVEALKR